MGYVKLFEEYTDNNEKMISDIINLKHKMNNIIHKLGYEEAYDLIVYNGGKSTVHDFLMKNNKEYQTLSNKWVFFTKQVYNYYVDKLTDTYNNFGEEETKKLFYEIRNNLNQNDVYVNAVGIISFDLTAFTRKLLKRE